MELRYDKTIVDNTPNTLKSVYIYSTGENDNWDTESEYDDIRFD